MFTDYANISKYISSSAHCNSPQPPPANLRYEGKNKLQLRVYFDFDINYNN